MTLILLSVGIPASLFIGLSLPPVQKWIKETVAGRLSETLDSEVKIRDLAISPFNRVTLFGVAVTDAYGEEAIAIQRLGAGISLTDLIFFGDIVINYIEIIGLDGRLYKENPQSELNISNIIEALKPKEDKDEEKAFRLSINSILLRNIDFRYDVLSESKSDDGRFNRNHVGISNLRADISIPVLSNNTYAADVYRLALEESSGFRIDDLHGRFFLGSDSVTVSNLGVVLPRSKLNFNDVKLEFNDSTDLRTALQHNILTFKTENPSYVTPADLSCFFIPLSNLTRPLDIDLELTGSAREVQLHPLRITSPGTKDFTLEISGKAYNLLDNKDRRIEISHLDVESSGDWVNTLLPLTVSAKVKDIVRNAGDFILSGIIDFDDKSAGADMKIETEAGIVSMDAKAFYDFENNGFKPKKFSAEILLDELGLGQLLGNKDIGKIAAEIRTEGKFVHGKYPESETEINVSSFAYKNYDYNDIVAEISTAANEITASLVVNDTALTFDMEAAYAEGHSKNGDITLNILNFNPFELNLIESDKRYSFSGEINANISGSDVDDITGNLEIDNLWIEQNGEKELLTESTSFSVEGLPEEKVIRVTGDRINMAAEGQIYFSSLKDNFLSIFGSIMPSLYSARPDKNVDLRQNFSYSISLDHTEWIDKYIKLPISSLDKVYITGSVNCREKDLSLNLTAPYLRQGNKLIEGTGLNLTIDEGTTGSLNLNTLIPTKSGMMDFTFESSILPDNLDNSIRWRIGEEEKFHGDISFDATLSRSSSHLFRDNGNSVDAEINLRQSSLTFNDSMWTVLPSRIDIHGKEFIKVDNFTASRHGQYVNINGLVSPESDDVLEVTLDNINLDYVFETLAINNVTIGGDATGQFSGSGLLSPEPHIFTDGLIVKGISYNASVVGDAFIKSGWNAVARAIEIDADITQPNARHTFIRGEILPLNDSLDLRFYPDKVEVGFLKPYMQAFTKDITGYASGEARLFGNFHDIDLTGRLLADSVRSTIDFTNVTYIVSDSVIIIPGLIKLQDLTLTDEYGHRAVFSGKVEHEHFRSPVFEFNLTEAQDLLVFNEPEINNPKWFGRVFGNGSATVKGGPGFVDITCDISTARGTTFTFVLDDRQNAGEYSFITFRDRDYLSIRDSLLLADTTPQLVKEFRSRQRKLINESSSRYDLDFNINVTPEAQMNLIMDPAGGDRIRAYGNGDIRMSYGSNDEDLKIYGTYTLTRGDYNFSLQEIIIKDFTIREGSSISFRGNPYQAILDITAVYALTANLSDLDTQFLEDKDISRTNVPVHALLHVAGDLNAPDISFDMEFPTLTQDVYRKVRSIVSTEDMMNRQMIYLLALNRFYTPEYIQSATKGNELISVASSTLSSQLSNILGQISDKWSIAPSIRSERSDFADMEVDVALSSSLLNNRLLLNGNFGYRDKMLNTNQFIGDFDVEYLLNRKGTLRLKAYNRYNDRNFYFKTAATTQGVGIMVKHDFDSFLNFLGMFRKNKENEEKN